MRIAYDPQADAIALQFSAAQEAWCEEVAPGLLVSRGHSGEIVALELLRAHWPIPLSTFDQITIEMRRPEEAP